MPSLIAILGLLLLIAGVPMAGSPLFIDRRHDYGGAWLLLLAVGSVLTVTGGLLLTWAHHL